MEEMAELHRWSKPPQEAAVPLPRWGAGPGAPEESRFLQGRPGDSSWDKPSASAVS
jgi:hypothetical protein